MGAIGVSPPLTLYAEGLRRGETVTVRFGDGSSRPLGLARWVAAADAVDESALRGLRGPVLDVGCGPGRHLHALTRRGVFGLGVDLSPVAVALARGGGARAIVASIFDELPGIGHWRSALLLDGNIGIGGDPARLLARIRGLLAPDGHVLVELAPPQAQTRTRQVRLETPRRCSDWFAWAEVSVADGPRVAADAGLRAMRSWSEGGRWFALLGDAQHAWRRRSARFAATLSTNRDDSQRD